MMIQMNQELPIDISLRNGKLKPPITIQTNEIWNETHTNLSGRQTA